MFFLFSFPAVFLFLSILSFIQFHYWSQSDFSEHLLPPYQPANYFIFYVLCRFFAPYLISAIGAFIFLNLAKYFNKKHEEKFFEPEEPYFGALAIFLAGYPGWFFYVIAVILIYLFLHLLLIVGCKSSIKETRLSLYHLWLPTAIFVIIINNFIIQNWQIWSVLKI